jgi:1-acyl-sn-glycerol-3-phosphate acyltransferase
MIWNPAENFKGFSMPLAESLLTGHQGWKLRAMYHYAEGPMERSDLLALPLVREKDSEKYGLPLDPKEYLRSLRRRVNAGYKGIVLFPEGTTEGGKSDNGTLNGMQEFDEGAITGHMGRLKKYGGRKVMLIPVGITGGSEIVDSNVKSIPLSSLAKIGDLRLVRIMIGKVIREDDPELCSVSKPAEIDQFVGKRIAQLLPPQMRGVYA